MTDILQDIGIILIGIACIFNSKAIIKLIKRSESLRICISLKRGGTVRTEEKPSELRTQTSEEEGGSRC